MGQFAEILHLTPWDVEEKMSVEVFDALEQYLHDREEAIRKAAKDGRA